MVYDINIRRIILLGIAFLIMVPPTGIDHTFIAEYDLYIRIAVIAIIFFLYLKKVISEKKIDIYLITLNCFSFIIILSSYIHKTDVFSAVWLYWINANAIVMLIDMAIEKDERGTLYAIFCAYSTLIILDAATNLLLKDIGHSYVFYNRNICIRFYLLALFTGHLLLIKGERVRIPYIIISCIATFMIVRNKGATSLIVICIWILYVLFINGRFERIFNIFTYIAVGVIGFAMVIISPEKNPIVILITNVLKKRITFSGRSEIWQACYESITKHPLFGIGVNNSGIYVEKLNQVYPDGHNSFIWLIYSIGFLGAIIFSGLSFLCICHMLKLKNKKMAGIMSILLFCLIIDGLFENLNITVLLTFLTLIYFVSKAENNVII